MENLNLNLPPFYIGQKVVCINDGFIHKPFIVSCGIKDLSNGKIYTVSEIIRTTNLSGYWFCWVSELPIDRNWDGFLCERFAPIEEKFISFADVIAAESPLIGIN